jgi:hypothetical protein
LGRAVPPKLENDCVVRVFQEYMVSFTYPLPAARYGFRGGFSAYVQFAAGLGLAAAIVIATVTPSWAQKAGGGKRTARVEIAEVKTQILSNFTEVQGRVTVGLVDSVTAVTNATTQLGEFRLGDQVVPGDVIAIQDSAKLELRLSQLRARLREAKLRLADSDDELRAEAGLLEVNKAQAELLAGKAKRAKELVANNALAVDAAETAFNASLTANLQLLSRESSIARKKAQRKMNSVAIAQTEFEIAQLVKDVKATKLRTQTAGQITFLADYRRGYAREGEIIAKITDLNAFEIEAEIPVTYLGYIEDAKNIFGRGLDGSQLDMRLRVSLPVQNMRSATRTMRFSVVGSMPPALQADNAVIVMQVPTTGPQPQVIVPKDAVLPVTGGHIVYLAQEGKAKRQAIQIGTAVKGGFIVLNGLASGQKVIVRGNEQLSDGKEIQIGSSGGDGQPRTGGKNIDKRETKQQKVAK